LNTLADASEGNFRAAVLYLAADRLTLREDLTRWQANPETIPKALNGWMEYECRRVVDGLPEGRFSRDAEIVQATLRLISTVLEPVSLDQLMTFLSCKEVIQPAEGALKVGPVGADEILEKLFWTHSRAAGLFQSAPSDQGARAPLRFFLASFPQWIRGQLPD